MTHKINVIYQDDNLLVLDKPPGLVVDPADSVKEETLVDILRREYGIGLERAGPPATHALALRAGIVHRLDKDTSGILLVAKTIEALENLQKQFQERVVKKEYLALVHGYIMESGRVEGSIGRNPGNREKFTVLPEGKEAVTEYEPVKNLQFTIYNLQKIFSDFNEQSSRAGFHPLTKIQMRKLERMEYGRFTLVKCHPKTGRTHQIRVHLKYIDHSVVSDEKYGGRKVSRLDKRWCPRIFLHAAKIGFKHPATGEWMELESPLPEDLKKALDNLK
ncbi:MAG: RluA family pseudouridine synthase [Candidatus Daviesbacteria bacterium]|nr:RluA family pseudouridine synthase [Candidatus Daviesbacteria bacterium]